MNLKFQKLAGALALIALASLNPQLSTVFAQATAFTYQGRLDDSGGPAQGTYDFCFKLFTDSNGNNQTGDSALTNGVSVDDGLFTATIDFGPGIFGWTNLWLQVSVRTNGTASYSALTPLQALTPTPYAIFAEGTSNVLGVLPNAALSGSYSGGVTFDNIGNQFRGSFSGNGGGLTNLDAATLGGFNSAGFWHATGNGGTAPGANFLGTTDNQPLEMKVNNARALRLEPTVDSPNVIGGSSHNRVEPGFEAATIAGGGLSPYPNVIAADFATIGGGTLHTVAGKWGTVGGGRDSSVYAESATIAGGYANVVESNAYAGFIGGGRANMLATNSLYATIAGGYDNTINTNFGTIGGGFGNTNGGPCATISGGTNNATSAFSATISGGANNSASGWASTVAGGNHNIASSDNGSTTVGGGNHNTASGDSSTVTGGNFNVATNSFASVGGGNFNTAGGYAATIPGGDRNIAVGPESFAAGHAAQALTRGSFVWADDQGGTPFASTGDDQFLIRATGGVGINTNATTGALTVSTDTGELTVRKDGPVPGLLAESSSFSGSMRFRNRLEVWPNDTGTADGFVDVRGTNGTPNITLDGESGNITCISLNQTSDRNAKANCSPVNPESVLGKVAALPITEWVYKSDAGARHIGPMAQDFHAAFGLNGSDDKHITTVDESGVALAAIQGLNEKVEAGTQKAATEIQKLKAENAELKQQLSELEEVVTRLNRKLNGRTE